MPFAFNNKYFVRAVGAVQNYAKLLDTSTAGTYSITLDKESVIKVVLVGGGGAAAMKGVYDDRGYGWTGGSGGAFEGSFTVPAGTYEVVVGSANNNNKAQGGNTNTMNPDDTSKHDSYITGVVRVGGGGSGTTSGVGAAGASATFDITPIKTVINTSGKAGASGSGGKGSGANWTHNGAESVYGGYGKGQGCSTSEYANRRYWIAGTNGYARVEVISKKEFDKAVKYYDTVCPEYKTIAINPDPADAVVTINGEVTNSKTFKKWTTVEYSVERDGYRSETGSVKLKDSVELDVSMLKFCIFTINPDPADAVVTINGEVRNSVTVVEGSEVSWRVSADGYEEQKGELVLSEDTSIDVALEEFKGVLKYVGVALYSANHNSTNSTNIATYSDDAVTWKQTTMPATQMWTGVGYCNGRFVAVGDGYDTNTSITGAYSDDGINWKQTTMPSYQNWSTVRNVNGRFMAYVNNSNVAAYSDDGINWTQITLSISDITTNTITCGDGMFVALGYNTETIWCSDDGINWNQVTTSSLALAQVAYGNGRFVVTTSENALLYSDDGINWKQTTMPSSQIWTFVVYGNGRFVALSGGFKDVSNVAAYSDDGINWTQITLPFSAGMLIECFMFGNSKFVYTGYDVVWYSDDGINWKQTTSPDGAWSSIVYG